MFVAEKITSTTLFIVFGPRRSCSGESAIASSQTVLPLLVQSYGSVSYTLVLNKQQAGFMFERA